MPILFTFTAQQVTTPDGTFLIAVADGKVAQPFTEMEKRCGEELIEALNNIMSKYKDPQGIQTIKITDKPIVKGE